MSHSYLKLFLEYLHIPNNSPNCFAVLDTEAATGGVL